MVKKRLVGSKRSLRISGKVRQDHSKRLPKINNVNRQTKHLKNAATLRSRQTIRRLKMYSAKPIRNKKGKIIHEDLQRKTTDKPVSRVQPDRRWFGNTRVVGQKELTKFREEMSSAVKDPYSVVLRQKKLPMSLVTESKKRARADILELETFAETFSQKRRRKRPKLLSATIESMVKRNQDRLEEYDPTQDKKLLGAVQEPKTTVESAMLKGQSLRIRGELYKMIDSSEVLIQVLDARDPLGTRSPHVEKYIRSHKHKHLIFVLNKCDLVPTWVTRRWIRYLSESAPTLAFHASITNSFGKGALIQLLRQFQILHPERQHISVGFFGYPNVGKSSIINTLVKKAACKVAPIPGETKVWQYISLFSKIYLIDCPGVVYPPKDASFEDIVLRGVVRVEIIEQPEYYVEAVLKKVRPEYIRRQYRVGHYESFVDFLKQLAVYRGKLLQKGEPDINCVARIVLRDWVNGVLPWFNAPPFEDDLEEEEAKKEAEKELKESRDKLENEQEILYMDLPKNGFHGALEFGKQDESEEAFRAGAAGGKATESDGQEGPTAEELKEMKVANPLGLAEDDPLIVEAKKRAWRERKQPTKKKS